jgi:hypothetical protein
LGKNYLDHDCETNSKTILDLSVLWMTESLLLCLSMQV